MKLSLFELKERLRVAGRDYLSVEAEGTAVVHVPVSSPDQTSGKFPTLAFLFTHEQLVDIELDEV